MAELEKYYAGTESFKVTPVLDPGKVTETVRSYDLEKPAEGLEVIRSVLAGMAGHTVHTPHPMYYGLFNPRANYAGIMADFITAVYNPQLAAWSHSTYASEVESYLVEVFGSKFGYEKDEVDGVFASGGAEANFTAIQCAMNHTFPETGARGIRELDKQPLPVVCFTDMSRAGDDQFARSICDSAVKSGKTWISVYPVHQYQTLRACITNYNTEKKHIRDLVTILGELREQYHAE